MAILRARDSFLVLVSISYKMPSCKVTSNHVCPLQQNVNEYFIPRYCTLFSKQRDLINLHKI